MALLLGSGIPFGEQPAAADGEGQDLSPIELPEKGNPKLDSPLNQLVSAETSKKAASFAQESNIDLVDGNVRVIVESLPEQVDAATKAAGTLGVVETSYRNLLQVVVPISRLPALADTPGIRLVRLPWYPLLDVISEGEARSYEVEIDGQNGRFTVLPPPLAISWPLVGGVIAAVAMIGLAIVLFVMRRRRTPAS